MRTPQKKVYLFEGMSPKGHVQLTKYYKNTFGESSTLYVGISLKSHYKKEVDVNYYNDFFGLKNKYFSIFSFLFYSLLMIIKCKKNNGKCLVFLSYNANVMFLVTWIAILFNVRILCFEHNTVPKPSESNLKKIAQRLCSKKLLRICYMPAVVELYEKLGQRAVYIPHPIINVEVSCNPVNYSKSYKYKVFCPSAQGKISKVKSLAENNKNVLFIVKCKEPVSIDNIVSERFFDNYYDIMYACDFVYLPVEFDCRVSGPFYEAIGFNKKVLVEPCGFSEYVSHEFQGMVVNNFEKSTNEDCFNVDFYNKKIRSSLEVAING